MSQALTQVLLPLFSPLDLTEPDSPQAVFPFFQPGRLVASIFEKIETPPHKPDAMLRGRDPALEKLARNLVRPLCKAPQAGKIQVYWNPRLVSTAGRAYYTKNQVQLNPRLPRFPGEVERTLLHELAHLLAHFRAGKRCIPPHGDEWRQACADLGIPDESTRHTLPLPRRRLLKKHHYRCPNCHHIVKRVVPFRRTVACLSCCRQFARGRFDERFRLQKVRVLNAP